MLNRKKSCFGLVWVVFTLIVSVVFVVVVGGFVRRARNYYLTFLKVADTTTSQLLTKLDLAWQVSQQWRHSLDSDQAFVYLILGTDILDYRPEDQINTDTMMLVSLHPLTNQATLLSLPRDIYLPDKKIKINALYDLALKSGSAYPERDTAAYLSQWLGISIDGSFVFTLAQVQELIDLLDGVEIEVRRGFTDELYPRSGVDVATVHDPALLYETIVFEPGKQLMNAETALKFMRSRHAVGVEGSDLARAARQQQVIEAFVQRLINRVFDQKTLFNYVLLGEFYRYYVQHYERYLPLERVLALVMITQLTDAGVGSLPQFKQEVLSVYPADPNGVLEEPTPAEMQRDYAGAWVWRIRDLVALKREVKADLDL